MSSFLSNCLLPIVFDCTFPFFIYTATYNLFNFQQLYQIRLRDDEDERIKNIEELAKKALTSSSNNVRKVGVRSIIAPNESIGSVKKIEKKKVSKKFSEVTFGDEDDDDHDELGDLMQ